MSDAHEPAADAEHAEHAEHAHGPQIPQVIDEAGDSPKWLPWLGMGLFFIVAVLLAGKSLLPEPAGAAEQAGVEAAEPADKPADEPADKPVAKPAAD